MSFSFLLGAALCCCLLFTSSSARPKAVKEDVRLYEEGDRLIQLLHLGNSKKAFQDFIEEQFKFASQQYLLLASNVASGGGPKAFEVTLSPSPSAFSRFMILYSFFIPLPIYLPSPSHHIPLFNQSFVIHLPFNSISTAREG